MALYAINQIFSKLAPNKYSQNYIPIYFDRFVPLWFVIMIKNQTLVCCAPTYPVCSDHNDTLNNDKFLVLSITRKLHLVMKRNFFYSLQVLYRQLTLISYKCLKITFSTIPFASTTVIRTSIFLSDPLPPCKSPCSNVTYKSFRISSVVNILTP